MKHIFSILVAMLFAFTLTPGAYALNPKADQIVALGKLDHDHSVRDQS